MYSSNCSFQTCIQISQEASQAVWYSHLFPNFPQFIVIHTVKVFSIVNKAEVDNFLELSCFFDDPMDVGNLISGSSAFSKSSLNIGSSRFMYYWSLAWNILSITSLWDECNCAVVWTFFVIAFIWDWNENWPFPVLGHCWVFQICWYNECSTLAAASFRIWNSSFEIQSPPLALFIVMLPKAHLTYISGYLALGEWSQHRDYLGREDLFCTVLLCILATEITRKYNHNKYV